MLCCCDDLTWQAVSHGVCEEWFQRQLCGAGTPLQDSAVRWLLDLCVYVCSGNCFCGWLATWRAVQKDKKNALKKNEKVSKIEVLGGLGPPWVTMWGPRGVGVTFLTFFNGFWCHFGDPFGRQFCRFSHSGGERCTR